MIIHVNQHIIRANKKNGTDDPPLTLRTYKGVWLIPLLPVKVVDSFRQFY